jgi:hypothetical protein
MALLQQPTDIKIESNLTSRILYLQNQFGNVDFKKLVSSLIFSGIMRFILLWYQTKISFAIGADISYNLYKNTLYKEEKQLCSFH